MRLSRGGKLTAGETRAQRGRRGAEGSAPRRPLSSPRYGRRRPLDERDEPLDDGRELDEPLLREGEYDPLLRDDDDEGRVDEPYDGRDEDDDDGRVDEGVYAGRVEGGVLGRDEYEPLAAGRAVPAV